MMHIILTLWTTTAAAEATVVAAFQRFNQHAHYDIPPPTSRELQQLLRGEVVTKLDQPIAGDPEAQRAIGMMLSRSSREALWVACQDPHFAQQSSTKELRLSMTGDRAVWYGLVDLPWPLSDRHWLLNVWNNHALAKAADNQLWEHPWELIGNGFARVKPSIVAGKVPDVDLDMAEEAIYTPMNQGAWVVMGLPPANGQPRSLLVYHAMTKVGGSLPQGLVTDLVVSGYEEMLSTIVKRAETDIKQHYNAQHPPLLGGDGQPVPTFR